MSSKRIEEIMMKNKDKIGISNVNNRIQLMYGEQYGVCIQSQVNNGTKILINLPLKE